MTKRNLSLEEILNRKTVLLPDLLAESAVSNSGFQPEEYKLFVNSCVVRFTVLYNNNLQFRGLIESNQRDTIVSFMAHWFSAYRKNPHGYMKSLGMTQDVKECQTCHHYHRVNYSGDCRNTSESFVTIGDAEDRLQKFVVEVWENWSGS